MPETVVKDGNVDGMDGVENRKDGVENRMERT